MRSPLDVKLSPPQEDLGVDLVFQRIGEAIPQAIKTIPMRTKNQALFISSLRNAVKRRLLVSCLQRVIIHAG